MNTGSRKKHSTKLKARQGEQDQASILGAGSDHTLDGSHARITRLYRCALRDYLLHSDKAHLQPAREMGTMAQRTGLGMFDLARLHEETLAWVLTFDGSYGTAVQQTRATETFLLEALSPFEAARRGLPEAYVQLEQLNETLKKRNKALGVISAREKLEAGALRASKADYRRLFREANSMKAEIRQHSAQVILAQEEERKRISRELHDDVGQALAAVNVGLVMLKKQAGHDPALQERVAATQALLEQSMESVHRFARELRPEMLDLFGPYEAIRSYVRAFAERTGITAIIHAKADLNGLDSEQEIVLFRVAQESITNISKHAQATRIDIRFRRQPLKICMEIKDNGRSFSVADKLGKKAGQRLGLLGMQERVRLVRGDFSIESAAGHGTKVRVQFPLAAANSPAGPGPGGNVPAHGTVAGAGDTQ